MCHHLIGTKTDFFLDCSIMEAKTPSFSWHAWKSIMKGRDVIREGGLWRIGDGRAISFWNSLNYGKKSPLWNHSRLKQCDNFIDLLGRILIENRDPTLFSMVICAVLNRRNNICLDKQTVTLTASSTGQGLVSGVLGITSKPSSTVDSPSNFLATSKRFMV